MSGLWSQWVVSEWSVYGEQVLNEWFVESVGGQ